MLEFISYICEMVVNLFQNKKKTLKRRLSWFGLICHDKIDNEKRRNKWYNELRF